jgi:multidrug efflux pump subunit AcrA (membrane-fusion protein)
MQETGVALRANSDALKSTSDFLSIVKELLEREGQSVPAVLPEHLTSVTDALTTTNDNLSQILNATDAIREVRADLSATPAETPTTEAPDLSGYQSDIAAAQSALDEARAELENYVIKAPIAGKIGKLEVLPGETVVDGSVIASIMTAETVARIALSEANVGFVQTGEPVTITFDAIEGFSLTGRVLAVDSAATIADGNVFFYSIVGFDAADPRARPGMTVTAHFTK